MNDSETNNLVHQGVREKLHFCYSFFYSKKLLCSYFRTAIDDASSPWEGMGNFDRNGMTNNSPMELLSDFPLLLSPFLRLDAADATGGP
jgi:hypothetical protein